MEMRLNKTKKSILKRRKGSKLLLLNDLLNVSADHGMIRPFYYRVYNNFYSISTLHNTSACFVM